MPDCFLEPTRPDTTLGHDGESVGRFLDRSTWPQSIELRRFLNRNLALLPPTVRDGLCRALHRPDFASALLELVAARMFQLLGATGLEYEPDVGTGRHPDLCATFEDGVVVVDAARPEWDQQLITEASLRKELVGIIEREIPDGWTFWAVRLPEIGHNESKGTFRKALREAFARVPAASAEEALEIDVAHERGPIKLMLHAGPRDQHGRAWRAGPFASAWGEDEKRIGAALARKRDQLAGMPFPALVVIGGGPGVGALDFDIALFGRTVGTVDARGRETSVGFDPSGIWGRSRNETPTIAGIIAIGGGDYTSGGDPILYLHPHARVALPAALRQLERRRLTNQGIEVTPGLFRGLFERLRTA